MKKNVLFLLIGLMIVMSGCSSESPVSKTEEEIRAEVKAELEAEEKLKEELRAEIEAEKQAEEDSINDESIDIETDSELNDSSNSESEQDSVSTENDASNETNVIDASDLVDGMTIEGYVLKDLQYIENSELSFVLEGKFELEGVLYNDMLWDEPRFEPKDGSYLKTQILFMEEMTIELPSKYAILGQYKDITQHIGDDNIKRVKSGEVLPVKLVAQNNVIVVRDGTEGHAGYETIISLEILQDESSANTSTNTQAGDSETTVNQLQKLSFAPETIFGTYIDYPEYHTVIVPMSNTSNTHLLARTTASFSDNPDNTQVRFTVFGEMSDVKLTYFENMGSDAEIIELGTLFNCYVDVYAPFGTDFSTIKVEGIVRTMEENIVTFNLDDIRDYSEYEIIMIK